MILSLFGDWREKWSLGPLGVRSHGRMKKHHAILDLKDIDTWEDWAATLKKSKRGTLTKQVPKLFDCPEPELTVRTIQARELTWSRHFWIVREHQCRVYSPWKGYIVAVVRFLVATLMTGVVDEYLDSKGVVHAWSHSIALGDTIRGMWFYQNVDMSKKLIWFHSLKIAVQRATYLSKQNPENPVLYVDVGPSLSAAVRKTKEDYGFVYRKDWGPGGKCATYHGYFRKLPYVNDIDPTKHYKSQ